MFVYVCTEGERERERGGEREIDRQRETEELEGGKQHYASIYSPFPPNEECLNMFERGVVSFFPPSNMASI